MKAVTFQGAKDIKVKKWMTQNLKSMMTLSSR